MKNKVPTPQFFEISPEFKTAAVKIMTTRSFAEVSNHMAIIRKDTFVYHIEELNTVIGYLGELPYSEVSKFFDNVRGWVKEVNEQTETTDAPVAPVTESSDWVREKASQYEDTEYVKES